ncbi:hypothetical protein [Treponema sp. UBA3813]|uniref:hypothetical protein n=1 Tax=Treponema sp. UBA3813 TaxID=1947715 RepID=UPI0025F2A75A|nr:hypothetical protein [Treponema sp. UBA3813]
MAQTEVDFFVVGGGCKMIEVKLSENPKPDYPIQIKTGEKTMNIEVKSMLTFE